MNVRVALASAVIGFSLSAAAADPLPRAEPESVGMSSERLARISRTINALVENGRLPGMVVAIARKGKLVYYEAFGWRDKEFGAPMTTDTIFSIASMTKPLVSAGTMLLYEEGRILISDPVGRYIPRLGKMQVAVVKTGADGRQVIGRVPATRQMTIRDLLRHTSGLTYGRSSGTLVQKLYPRASVRIATTMTAEEFIDKLGTLPLAHQPGTVWEYGVSTDVLGIVLEKVSGQTLGTFLEERIWKPLGMSDTGFAVPVQKASRYAKMLPQDPDTGERQRMVLDSSKPTRFECGGSCAVSTVGDYLRFVQMLLNGGRLGDVRILGRKTVEYMTSDHLGPEIHNHIASVDPGAEGYGFGLGVAVRRETGIAGVIGSRGEYGWGGAYGTYFWADPKEELAVVYMSHAHGPARMHYRQLMKALVLQAIEK